MRIKSNLLEQACLCNCPLGALTVILPFNDNLLALNQLLKISRSLSIFLNKTLMSLCEKRRIESSANMIGFDAFEGWCKSFTYNSNNKSPKKDPWRTPHVTVAFAVKWCIKEINSF